MVLSAAEAGSEEHRELCCVLEGRRGRAVDRTDATYLARAVELAARAIADAEPNPPVGAVIVRDGVTLAEGWHHRRGEPHAEAEALRLARESCIDVRGATMYVTLEPHDHQSTNPPCSLAVIAAGVARVVVGAIDPNERTHGRGVARMRQAGVTVDVVDDPHCLGLIERFAFIVGSPLPYVTLKMAMSLDGFIAPAPGTYRVTGEEARRRVFDLRAEYDAVMVGAGTVRIDDPLLTMRPHRVRRKPYARVVVCETATIPLASRVLAPAPDAPTGAYRATIVLAPAGLAEEFAPLTERADVLLVGERGASRLDLDEAMVALRDHGVSSVLCEGGPTLAARLLARGLVQRIIWLVAPKFLRTDTAIPVFTGADLNDYTNGWTFERVETLGEDLMITARLPHV